MSLIVTTADLYSVPSFTGQIGYCAEGARAWFAAHDLSWRDFVFNGIDAEILMATGDPMALRLVEHARHRAHGEMQHGQEKKGHDRL